MSRDIQDRDEASYSPGQALVKGTGAGVVAFLLGTLVIVGLFDCDSPFGMTQWGAAVAAGVAALKMGAPVGRVILLGVLAAVGSSLLFWFAGCTIGTLLLYTSVTNWPDPGSELSNAFKILGLWGFILSIILICLGAVFGAMFGEPGPEA